MPGLRAVCGGELAPEVRGPGPATMPYLPHQEPDRFRFRWNSLAVTRYDVCLIGVTCDYLLVAWRFEDA